MSTKKKMFRFEGVNRGKDLAVFARELEEKMNGLHKAGYDMVIIQEEGGVVIRGELQEEEKATGFAAAMQHLVASLNGDAPATTTELGPWAAALARALFSDERPDVPVKLSRLREKLPALVARFSPGELKTIAEEFRKEAVLHKARCGRPNCQLTAKLGSVGSLLEDQARISLS